MIMNIFCVSSFLLLACISDPILGASVKCGHSKYDAEYRIVGGAPAKPLQFPWQARLSIVWGSDKFGQSWTVSCGGSLINKQWIATAGHCMDPPNQSNGKLIGINVVLGDENSKTFDGNEVYLSGMLRLVHPDYDTVTKKNDIALVLLEREVDFDGAEGFLQPICMPKKGIVVNGSECVVSGYGDTSHGGQASNLLLQVKLPMLNDSICAKTYPLYYNGKNFCAGYMEGGKDSCQGDSGGPYQCPVSSGAMVLTGIVSQGEGCAEKNFPGMYTRVEDFVDWINDWVTMWNDVMT